MAIIRLFPPKANNVEQCTMSFWNVLISFLKILFLGFMYGFGFEVGYTDVMDGHNLVPAG